MIISQIFLPRKCSKTLFKQASKQNAIFRIFSIRNSRLALPVCHFSASWAIRIFRPKMNIPVTRPGRENDFAPSQKPKSTLALPVRDISSQKHPTFPSSQEPKSTLALPVRDISSEKHHDFSSPQRPQINARVTGTWHFQPKTSKLFIISNTQNQRSRYRYVTFPAKNITTFRHLKDPKSTLALPVRDISSRSNPNFPSSQEPKPTLALPVRDISSE